MSDEVPADTETDASDQQAAMQAALALLRSKNIKEYHSVLTTSSLRFPNGKEIVSGVVVAFKNKGPFDGNWIIQKVTFRLIDGKLMNEIEFRKCLPPGTAKILNSMAQLAASSEGESE
jgi:hypothetical protein